MRKNEIKITIEGQVNCGKTTLAIAIKKFLISQGLDVSYENKEYETSTMDALIQNNDKIFNSVKKSITLVEIKEKQSPKPSIVILDL